MRMRAAVARGPQLPFDLVDVELEEPRTDEVLVRLVASGICHTDLIIRDGWFPTPMPAVLGHEGGGVVERVGRDVTGVGVGDQVVLTYSSCHRCRNCLSGAPAYCENFWAHNFAGSRPDGSHTIREGGIEIGSSFFGQSSFAQYALVNQRGVVPVGSQIDLRLAGPLGCGIQTGTGAVLNTLRPQAGTSIAVFGAGAVGLSAVMAAKLSGCTRIIAVDRVATRLDLALEVGATDVIVGADAEAARAIRKLTNGGVEFAVEATGVPEVLRVAMDSLAQRGTCGLVGAAAARTTSALDMSTLLFGRKLVGIVEGDSVPAVFIPRLLDLHAQGSLPFDKIVTLHAFDDINEAVKGAESGELVKPVVVMA
jgi:aryl-alcohol dehydrogenase